MSDYEDPLDRMRRLSRMSPDMIEPVLALQDDAQVLLLHLYFGDDGRALAKAMACPLCGANAGKRLWEHMRKDHGVVHEWCRFKDRLIHCICGEQMQDYSAFRDHFLANAQECYTIFLMQGGTRGLK